MKKENEVSCLVGPNIIFNGLYLAIKNNIVTKNTTELVLLFHKNITKLVFLWPNMNQKKHQSVNIVCSLRVICSPLKFTVYTALRIKLIEFIRQT